MNRLCLPALLLILLMPRLAKGQPPLPPRSFEAIAASPTEIRCYWLPAPDATGYRLKRDGQPIADLPAAAQQYADTGLTPDSTHRYEIQALSANGESPARAYTERAFALFPANQSHAETQRRGAEAKGERRKAKEDLPQSKIQNLKSKIPAPYDVIIVQASSGGVAAAVEAAKRGWKVALIEPTTRLGGMPVNGLSASDIRRPEHAAGFFARFRDRVRDLYAAEGVKTNGLEYEPRVAHQAMKSLLYEQSGITIFRRTRLAKVRAHDTLVDGSRRRVDAVEVEELNADGQPTGQRAWLTAKVFIDATDCGDLAAGAGAAFHIGREARSPQEPHNGVIYYDRAHDKLLPGSTGQADKRIQSYAYLLTVKDYGAGADKTIPRPSGYRKEDFIHSPEWQYTWAVTSGKMPNSKMELNQHPQGNDLGGINYQYPTGDYRERARMEKRYRERILQYLYYIQTELGQKQIGLPDDEYRDTGGFPPLLYVREGRRIEGEQTPTENEIAQAQRLVRPESVGIGDYPMDSHAVRPKTDWTTTDMGEGEWWLYQYTPWHRLPLGVMIPKKLENVFVTTAVSSTHVSFGTYRLEPVRMQFGQAAAIASDLCLRYSLDARDVPARQVQWELLPRGGNPDGDPYARLYYLSDVDAANPHLYAIQYLYARGFQFQAEAFKPDAPTTRGELAHWLVQLAERSPLGSGEITQTNGRNSVVIGYRFSAYLGAGADVQAAKRLQALPDQDKPVTRREVAHWLRLVMRWNLSPDSDTITPADLNRYADVEDAASASDAASLYLHHIDSRLWHDDHTVFAPDGRLRFQPDAPLRHDDMFETLYLAQLAFGPLFEDNPVDTGVRH